MDVPKLRFKHVLAAIGSTALAVLLTDIVFAAIAGPLEPFRQMRTEFAFHPFGTGAYVAMALSFLTGLYALPGGRTVVLPLLVSVFVTPIFIGAIAWSGPGDLLHAIEPLVGLKMSIPTLIVLFNGLLVTLWGSLLRRQSEAQQSDRAAASSH